MNMIPRKRLRNRGGRGGFTLVEVIVVLVILAILAAIAIPALTGYIDKAEEKKWISQARSAITAMRTAIDEDYADGKLNPSVTYGGINYFSGGEINGSNKVFDTSKMSRAVWEDNPFIYGQRSAAFIGETFVNSSNAPGYWLFYIIAPDDPSYTILNAPSFIFRYYPDGQKKDNTFSAVFYGFDNIPSVIEKETDIDNALSQITCNPDAGYKVFTNLTRNR